GAGGADLADGHAVGGGGVVDRPAEVGAVTGGAIHAERKQDALRAGIERYLADAPGGVLPQGDDPRGIAADGPGALDHPVGRQGQHRRAGVVGQDTGVAGRPAGRELWPVQQQVDNQGGADRPDELGNVVVVGEVLAHQGGQQQFGDFDELDGFAGYVHCLPPADVGVQGAAQVVLVDLAFVQRPAVVFVLADVKPGLAPFAPQPPTLLEPGV